MNIKKNVVFSLICIIILFFVFYGWHNINQKNIAYQKLYLDFKKTDVDYEIGEKIDPIIFIKKTNAKDIEYPTINPKAVGEYTYVYIAKDDWGNRKQFVLKLKFVDPIIPVLTLTTNYAEIYEGDKIDFNSFIKEAYDEVDGDLNVKINAPNTLNIGENKIIYSVIDKHKNKVEAILILKVNPKPVQSTISEDTSSNKLDNSNKKFNAEDNRNKINGNQKEEIKDNSNLPDTKIFTIDEYGSIAGAEAAAKEYASNNCPSNHYWFCNPYSDDTYTLIGYIVTFK